MGERLTSKNSETRMPAATGSLRITGVTIQESVGLRPVIWRAKFRVAGAGGSVTFFLGLKIEGSNDSGGVVSGILGASFVGAQSEFGGATMLDCAVGREIILRGQMTAAGSNTVLEADGFSVEIL